MTPATFKKFVGKYKSEKDIIENLYFPSLLITFERVKKKKGVKLKTENEIRDIFIYNLQFTKTPLQKWLDNGIIRVDFERQIIHKNLLKNRTDISLFLSSFDFIIECKRISFVDNRYFEEGLKRYYKLEYAEKSRYASMLSFVIGGVLSKILHGLKKRVKSYYSKPTYDYLLNKKCLGWSNSFQSKFIRKNRSPIHIFHLFCDFN